MPSIVFDTPTDELEAVNIMLGVIGEDAVNSLDNDLVVDAVTARKVLREISRTVQVKGWDFNVEEDYPLSRNVDGTISLPPNCVRVHVDQRRYQDVDPVQRGTRLYDRCNHTYAFGRTIHATVTLLLPFDELPEAARYYVTIRAARTFGDRMVGGDAMHVFTERDEVGALATLMGHEAETAKYNILTF